MQSSRLVHIIAAASIVLVALALMGASWYAASSRQAAAAAMVGVATGEYVNGVEVQRLPSITVTARRSDVEAGAR
jgi:flagellar basal body-associated protein FliL